MFTSALLLTITYILFKYTVSWIKYYNQIDLRMPNSLWRYTADYRVKDKKDLYDLSDKPFVILRNKRDSLVTIMYFIVILAFLFLTYLITGFVDIILGG
tara:strand:+ start:2965 stop:3261 length:297 start_codon:yes stop_codon:yes gene_type:complete